MDFATARKKIEKELLTTVALIEPEKTNHARYKAMFEGMSDTQFRSFMKLIESGKYQVHMLMPNHESNIKIPNILKAAEHVGVTLDQHLIVDDEATGLSYTTPNTYMCMDSSVRIAQQYVKKKRSTPHGDQTIDGMTGQVTGADRAAAITRVGAQMITTRGLDKALTELYKGRGGDVETYGEIIQQAAETGIVDMEEINTGTRARSPETLSVFATAMGIENNI